MRRLLWEPPEPTAADLVEQVTGRLTDLGARAWQVELTRELLAESIREAKPPA